MLKLSVLLIISAVACQTFSSSAAPLRPAPDSLTDTLALMDLETRRLLSAIVRSVEQLTEEPDDNRGAPRKRACNTATCVTHRLADFLSRSGGIGNGRFVPTNVGSKAFGRRRRRSARP